MTNADSRPLVIVDTNVLLAATDRSRRSHGAALALLNHDARQLAVTPQIIREYLVVATRPVAANGLGLPGSAAAGNMAQLLEDMATLAEDRGTARRVLDWVSAGTVLGKQIHDANIVAVAIANGAQAIVTDNAAHFARFSDVIDVEGILR